MSKWKVNEIDGEFMEHRVFEGNFVSEDIIVGSLFYFLKDFFDFYEFILDI